MPTIEQLRPRLAAIGQEHLLAFAKELTAAQGAELLEQVASIDLAALPGLVEAYVRGGGKGAAAAGGAAGAIEPVPYYSLGGKGGGAGKPFDEGAYRKAGEEMVRRGEVAAFTVAGGQGSRLGYDGPKGCFPGGAVTGKPLFACLAEWILAAQRRWCGAGVTIPWYIMTSPLNHAQTVAFFKEHAFFGLREKDVMFFPQGVMPAFDMATARVLLSEKHTVALSPDGHGGSLTALWKSGAVEDMRRRGVKHISYTQIDNPLVRVVDPLFLGLHAKAPDSSGEMSSKMIAKAHPGEKVGVFCRQGGKTAMIEYSDLPAELAGKVDASGRAVFNAGNPAIHVLSVDFVARLNTGGSGVSLPYHRAEKKVGYVDLSTGRKVEPEKPNAVKLEMFVFDALPLCASSIVVETDRVEEFAPIKNATGTDSVESCRRLQTLRAARWIAAAGCAVPMRGGTGGGAAEPDCTLELSPLTAMTAEEARGVKWPASIPAGASVVL